MAAATAARRRADRRPRPGGAARRDRRRPRRAALARTAAAAAAAAARGRPDARSRARCAAGRALRAARGGGRARRARRSAGRVVRGARRCSSARPRCWPSRCPWPGELAAIALPAATAPRRWRARRATTTARRSASCGDAAEHALRVGARDALDALLRGYGERYAALKAERSALDFEDLELIARELLAGAGDRRAGYRDAVRARDGRRAAGHQPGPARADRPGRGAATCSWSATRSSRSTASATPTSSCSRRAGARSSRAARGCRCSTNFRSRPEILDGAQRAPSTAVLGERFRPLRRRAGASRPRGEPLVELLIVDKGGRLGGRRPRGTLARWPRRARWPRASGS